MFGFIAPIPSCVAPCRSLCNRNSHAVSPRSRPSHYLTAVRMSLPTPSLTSPTTAATTSASPMEVSAAPGTVITVKSPEQFDSILAASDASDSLLVVDFHAEWCRKCKYLLPRFRKLSAAHPGVYFATVDVNAVARLPREFSIEKMPTFILFRNKKPVHEFIGGAEPPAVASTLAALVEEHSSPTAH
jgi:thioredoxin 1